MKFRKIAATLLVASSLAFPCMSYAQSNATPIQPKDNIQVQLNGEDIKFTDAQPVIDGGHVYVPFRSVFESLKAEVNYDAVTGKITAKRDDKTVSLKSGSTEISLDNNGTASKFTVDSPVFIKSGNTYVPVKTIAEAFGCRVGWDSSKKTVVVVDKDLYSKSLSGSYTYADKLFSFLSDIDAKDKAIDCKLNMLTGFKNDEGKDASVTVNFAITGNQTKDATSMNIAVTSSSKNIDKLLADAGEKEKKILKALESSNMSIVFDSKNTVIYAKGELISLLLDVPSGTWVTLSKNDLESLGVPGGESLSYLFSPMNQMDFKGSVDTSLAIVPVNDSVTAKAIFDTLDSTLSLYKDSSFKKTATGYTSTGSGNIADGMKMTNTLNMSTDSTGNVTGYDCNSVIDLSGITSMNVNGKYTADTASMTMTMDMPEILSLKIDLNAKYTYGAQPAITVPSGNTVSLIDKLSGLFGENK